jgi:PadR family transcriptional regulator PadR
MVKSEFGEATNIRGGKRKRLYEITSIGKNILSQAKEQRNSLWDAIPKVVFKFT